MRLRGLRQARQRHGYSISQLATLTGLRRETITQIEHGKIEPQPYAIHRLALALETSPADLTGAPIDDTPIDLGEPWEHAPTSSHPPVEVHVGR